MSLSLTELISQVQALFMDDGTRFTDAVSTAAIRQALKDYNASAPIHAADVIASVSGQYEYAVPAANALYVVDVLLQGSDPLAENHQQLAFNAYFEDESPYFRLQVAQATGYLIVRYVIPHTINGLDGSVESTLPAGFDSILLDGACYRAALARSSARIEEINLNAGVTALWRDIAKEYKEAFEIGLVMAARQNAPAVPLVKGWAF